MRVLIVDDEPFGRDIVRLALDHEINIDIVGEARSGAEAAAMIRDRAPDIIFLDIEMPAGDGFSVVEEIGPDSMPAVIFVTAYDAHALRAFDSHAVDYLLKPFSNERFGRAMRRARELIQARDALALGTKLRAVLRDIRGGEELGLHGDQDKREFYLTRIAVKDDERYFFVRAADIDWVEGAGNYVRLHVREAQHRVRLSLRDLSRQLDPIRFRRIHRSAIVNVERIKEVQPWFGGDHVAILADGQRLRVSRTFAAELLRTIQ